MYASRGFLDSGGLSSAEFFVGDVGVASLNVKSGSVQASLYGAMPGLLVRTCLLRAD